jgi:CPA2 family monovalent cation:H+ antiporter-2
MATGAMSLYTEALLLLGAAVVATPVFKRVGLGTVLGYLTAGIVIGPIAGLITDGEEILHFAELGVVFLLFVIGLELKPARLWALRRSIFGLGLTQVAACGAVLAGLAAVTGVSTAAAIVAGLGMALSSTAFALQILEERGDLNRGYGQQSFSILLFQDLAIVPLLALIPLLAPSGENSAAFTVPDLLLVVAAIGVLLVAGRYLLNPLFGIIANTGAREVMIAAALLVVLGAATLMQAVGMSMAMGAFIAGVLLAESAYRHELEADIEPFRGILLGLFFMAVGLSLDLVVVRENWLLIALAVPVVMAVKSGIIYGLCRGFGSDHRAAVQTALLLPQGGEFGFVLFQAAAAATLFDAATASLLVAVVTMTMALTPLVQPLAGWLVRPQSAETMDEDFADAGSDVLMIGFSRFGQIASQMLLAGGRDVTIIDQSAERVRSASTFGFRIYYGDGTRLDVLEAAGIRKAKIVAICTNHRATTDRIVGLIHATYPDVKLYVRSYDRAHAIDLRKAGVDYELRETFESGLMFGKQTLEALGMDDVGSDMILEDVRQRDAERLSMQIAQGLAAGNDRLHTRPVPEPLTKPRREGRITNASSGKSLDDEG